tara:strand:+ start:224 stop:484 length:261 start_codon:yes stop_codon:yes gene_type:complete
MAISKNNKRNRKGKIYLSHNEWKKRQNMFKLGLRLARNEEMKRQAMEAIVAAQGDNKPQVEAPVEKPINTDELVHGSEWWSKDGKK